MRHGSRAWVANLGAVAVGGLCAGLGRWLLLGGEILLAPGESARPADLLLLLTQLALLYLLLAGFCGLLLTPWLWRPGSREAAAASSGAAGVAWAVCAWFLIGGFYADELALFDPLGKAHLLARALSLVVAIGIGVARGRAGRRGLGLRCSVAWVAATLLLWGGARVLTRVTLPQSTTSTEKSETPPDLLVLLVDTLRADHLGSYGYELRPTTPTLDSLATAGVLFEQTYTHWTRTAPAHASLFSGRYPHEHGLIANGQILNPELPLLAEALQDAGYITVGFVSNPFLGRRYGFDRGFDTYVELSDFALSGAPPAAWLRRLPLVRFFDRYRDEQPIAELAEEWLARHPRRAGDAPVALVLQWIDPHMPYRPPRGLLRAFDADYRGALRGTRGQIDAINAGQLRLDEADVAHMVARYDAEIRGVDDAIGRTLRAWRRARPGPSLVTLTADHGENMHEHAQPFRHPPEVHESLARVPWLIAGQGAAGVLPSPLRVATTVEQVAFGATLLDLLGIPRDPAESAAPLIARAAVDRAFGSSPSPPGQAVVESAAGGRRRTALVRGRWKLVREVAPEDTWETLWDLRTDPHELRAANEPDTSAVLSAELDAWFEQQDPSAHQLLMESKPLPVDQLDEQALRALRALGYL